MLDFDKTIADGEDAQQAAMVGADRLDHAFEAQPTYVGPVLQFGIVKAISETRLWSQRGDR
jgi:hypothetical protein